MMRIPLSFLGVVSCVVSLGCSPVNGVCAAAAECDDLEASFPLGLDLVGESNDSYNVCVAEQNARLRTLRANEEEGCQEEAIATEAYFACVADVYAQDPGDACDGFVLFDDNPCEDELDDMFDAIADNEDDCSRSEK